MQLLKEAIEKLSEVEAELDSQPDSVTSQVIVPVASVTVNYADGTSEEFALDSVAPGEVPDEAPSEGVHEVTAPEGQSEGESFAEASAKEQAGS